MSSVSAGPEKIHRHEPVGHAPDHLVAVGADRRQVDEIVEQAERLDRRHGIRLALEEQVDEGGAHVVLRLPRHILVEEVLAGDLQRQESLAPVLLLEIKRTETAQRAQLQIVAAPAIAQMLESCDGGVARDRTVGETAVGVVIDGFGGDAFVARHHQRREQRMAVMRAAFGSIEPCARKLRVERKVGCTSRGRWLRAASAVSTALPASADIGLRDARARLPVGRIAMQDRFGHRQRLARAVPVMQEGSMRPRQ